MKIVVDSLTKDTVLVSVVGEHVTVKLKIVKDQTRRDKNNVDFYVTTFIMVDILKEDLSPCQTPEFLDYQNNIGRHPYLAEGEEIVTLNTGIPELDLLPVAVGEDYARVYYYPYDTAPISYGDGRYDLRIADQRLRIVNVVNDFLYYKVETITEEELETLKRPWSVRLAEVDELFRKSSLFS